MDEDYELLTTVRVHDVDAAARVIDDEIDEPEPWYVNIDTQQFAKFINGCRKKFKKSAKLAGIRLYPSVWTEHQGQPR